MTFTQFLRPNGRRREVTIERDADVEALAKRLVEQYGCKFEVEELTTGAISMEVVREVEPENEDDDGHRVLAGELVSNDKKLPPALDRMIRRATDRVQS